MPAVGLADIRSAPTPNQALFAIFHDLMNNLLQLLRVPPRSPAHWLAALLLAVAIHAPALGQTPPNVTAGELALLPAYCPDTQGFHYGDATSNTSPRAGYWLSKMGPAFWAVHHHCWGLIKVRRATAPGVAPPIRTGLLKAAIGDYQYVVRHSDRSFVLLPDIYLKMGEAYLLLGDIANAATAFTEARQLRPDFWPAYAGWAEALYKSGNRAGALIHLEEGMRHSPNARELQQQYQRYGGDAKKFLAQLPRPAAPAASGVQAVEQAASGSAQGSTPQAGAASAAAATR